MCKNESDFRCNTVHVVRLASISMVLNYTSDRHFLVHVCVWMDGNVDWTSVICCCGKRDIFRKNGIEEMIFAVRSAYIQHLMFVKMC